MDTKFIMVFCIVSITNFVMADDNVIISNYFSTLKATIQSENPFDLEKFVKCDTSISDRISTEICNFLEKTTVISQKCRALYILGILKNSNSIPVIIKHIDLYNPIWSGPNKEIPLIAASPAKQALVTIGMKSLPYVIEEFLTSENATKRYLCLETIFEIYGNGLSKEEALEVVRFTIKNKIEKSSSPHKQLLGKELNNYIPGNTYVILASSLEKDKEGK